MQSHIVNILLGITAIVSSVAAILIYNTNRKSYLHAFFALILFCGGGWGLSILLTILSGSHLISNTSFFFAILMIAFIVLLLQSFDPRIFGDVLRRKKAIYFTLIPAGLIALVSLYGRLLVSEMRVTDYGTLQLVAPGPVMPVYSLFVVLYIVAMIVFIIRAFGATKVKVDRLRLLYAVIAVIFTIFFGTILNFVLPLLGQDRYNNLGPITMLVVSTFMAYAATKHYLYGVQVVFSEMWAYLLMLIALVWLVVSVSLFNIIFFVLVVSICFRVIFSVISEAEKSLVLKKQRDQLEKDKLELQKLDQLKDEFLQMATHELNTPISVVKGRLSMILEDNVGNFDQKQKEYLSKIDVDIKRLASLSKDILNVARIDQKKIVVNKKEFNIEELIREIQADLEPRARAKNIKINLSKKVLTSIIMADQSKIGEIITNLLSNAIKFTPVGGMINISLTQNKDGVMVSVKDNGCGIFEQEQKNIFGKFFQAGRFRENNPQEQQGSGLGLYISKKMIELHGGKIWFHSKENEGSEFSFSIPA